MQPMIDNSASPNAMPVTPSMFESLRATRPWVLFLGILSFIGAGLMVLVALAMMVAGAAGGAAAGLGLGALYILLAVVCIVAGVYLVRYAGGVKRLFDGGGPVALEEALAAQKSYWKFVGIVMIVYLALLVVVFALALAGGAGMLAGLRG